MTSLEDTIRYIESLHECYVEKEGFYLTINTFKQLTSNDFIHIKTLLKYHNYDFISLNAKEDLLKIEFIRCL